MSEKLQHEKDGCNYYQHIDTAGVLELYYEFDVGGDDVPTAITVTDRINDSGYEVQMAVGQTGVYRHRVKVDPALGEWRERVAPWPWIPGLPPK